MSGRKLASETIYDSLRKAIINGNLKPGERLVELEVAKTYNTSQVPVREAFQKLEMQSLIRGIKHTGTFVSEISIYEMQSLFEQRKVIEKYAIKQAIYLLNEEHKITLHKIYEQMKESAENSDLETLIEMDMLFHQTIIQISGRKLSLQMWNLIDGHIRRFLMITHPKFFSNLMEVALTHKPMLDAITTGNADEAIQSTENHVRLIWDKIGTMNSFVL